MLVPVLGDVANEEPVVVVRDGHAHLPALPDLAAVELCARHNTSTAQIPLDLSSYFHLTRQIGESFLIAINRSHIHSFTGRIENNTLH